MLFDEIVKKLIEEEDKVTAKAFTNQISELLKLNGITPVAEKIETDTEIIADINNYIIRKQFCVAFNKLDCKEHDRKYMTRPLMIFTRI